MALLIVKNLAKNFGSTLALAPTSLTIAQGEFVTLLGPSGCGKSTLLRMICGITPASGGEIFLAGQRIDPLPPEKRDIAMVFQSYALFPHMSVRKNLAFGLQMKKVPSREQRDRLDHAVAICKLEGLLDRMPRQLSGGQQQRVALARAVVMRPALMLYDEPMSSLDAKLRDSLREDIAELHRSVGATSLYVTHDQSEALALSDRVLIMNSGTLVEDGTPIHLYRHPRHAFTAQFLGQTNLLSLPVLNKQADFPWGERIEIIGTQPQDRQVCVSLRPEDIRMDPDLQGQAVIEKVVFTGAQVAYTVWVNGTHVRVLSAGTAPLLALGQRVRLRFNAAYLPCALQGAPCWHAGQNAP